MPQVEDLVTRGGTIRDRYELLLQQQWERRKALAQMGELSGMFKFLVRCGGLAVLHCAKACASN